MLSLSPLTEVETLSATAELSTASVTSAVEFFSLFPVQALRQAARTSTLKKSFQKCIDMGVNEKLLCFIFEFSRHWLKSPSLIRKQYASAGLLSEVQSCSNFR
jgi:hypothetical protein